MPPNKCQVDWENKCTKWNYQKELKHHLVKCVFDLRIKEVEEIVKEEIDHREI